MQTIEEYKAYTRQLEAEVGKWHHAYDALMVERNQMAARIAKLERKLKQAKGFSSPMEFYLEARADLFERILDGKWIPVSESVPTEEKAEGQHIIAVDEYGDTWLCDLEDRLGSTEIGVKGSPGFYVTIICWMPLPPKPTFNKEA